MSGNLERRQRVVVTGRGVISPIGSSVLEYWQGLSNAISGVRKIIEFDPTGSACQIAGTVKDFDADSYFSRRENKSYERFTQLGLVAAKQAIEEAQFQELQKNYAEIGVVMGTGVGGITSYAQAYDALYAGPKERPINAYTIPRIMNSAVSSAVAISLGVCGPNITINTACSSGANAIGLALQWIREGRMPAVICGGAEAPVTYGLLRAWDALGVLSRKYNSNPEKACRPFDKNRRGFVLAEGAAVFVLESLESALNRKAHIFGEISGFGSNCDATSMTNPDENGVAESMRLALKDAAIDPEEIDYINAHGTATRLNDPLECRAVSKVFGKCSNKLPVSSTKSLIGHAMGASSALEALATLLAVQHDCALPTLNCDDLDPECAIDPVANKSRKVRIDTAISNSFAFGGSNAVLVFKKWKK
ncbi:MAG: beta-ketoacyl-[acyl-carrier-protein] synthase family protein [SAR324 cluster bacterium]|nr:beta-ketoacyl-[acyl-carrier-protein] synthase family protein [SAR324 cluster bacterium]MBL7035215.1 beta-ketoacyl-[acyl-carrier-protein] synthase family protein [SAR324 cluster bacterium]